MPFFYTHIRYGEHCIEKLSEEYKKIINDNIDYFYIGILGPNIFNYHSPFINKKYNEISKSIHMNQLATFIKRIKTLFLNNKNRDEILAFSFGYVSHFILDSYCDDYIIASSKRLNISINQLESEIDKYYLLKDKVQDIKNCINKIKINKQMVEIISRTYEINPNIISQSLSNLKIYINILNTKNNLISNFLSKILHLFKYTEYYDIFLNNSQIEHYAQITRIEKYFEISLYHYKLLINNFLNYIFYNEEINDYFYNSFINNNRKIDVLDISEEKHFIIKELLK